MTFNDTLQKMIARAILLHNDDVQYMERVYKLDRDHKLENKLRLFCYSNENGMIFIPWFPLFPINMTVGNLLFTISNANQFVYLLYLYRNELKPKMIKMDCDIGQ